MHSVPTPPDPHRYIERYLTDLRYRQAAESTIDTYTNVLNRAHHELFEGLPYAHADEIREWIWAGNRKPASLALYRTIFAGFFAYACDEEHNDPPLDYNPMRHVPAIHVPRRASRTVPTDQVHDILARAADPVRLWCLLAAGAGLRCVEISHLDRGHVDQAQVWIQGKGGKERTVPTHPAVWAAVRGLPAGPVARQRDGVSRATRQQVRMRANRHLSTTLGYPGTTMHRLRHWFATAATEAPGGELSVTQELLGHASPATTRIYVDVNSRRKAAAVAALPLA